MNISDTAEILGSLDATENSAEKAIAMFILRHMDGYKVTTRTWQSDVERMAIYIQSYAKLVQNAGVKII